MLTERSRVLNVNGHEETGRRLRTYRRVHQPAKRGILALNPEWVGRTARHSYLDHARMNQVDLTGTSGVAIHFLRRSAPSIFCWRTRIRCEPGGGDGLSGSWQTIIISSLDTRVKLLTRWRATRAIDAIAWPEPDLGIPSRHRRIWARADYTHLTGMLAPRPALLTHNSRDNCCFRADYAVSPLLMAARHLRAVRKRVTFATIFNYDDGTITARITAKHSTGAADYFSRKTPASRSRTYPVEKEIRTRSNWTARCRRTI